MIFAFRTVLLSLVAAVGLAGAQEKNSLSKLEDRERRVIEVVRKVSPSVVALSDGEGWGSGVIVSNDGLILTAGHVSMHSRAMRVILPDGRRVRARSLGRNLNNDSALLKLTEDSDGGKDWPAVELGSTATLERGTWTLALGHPGGLEQGRTAPVRLGRVLSVGARTVVTDATIIVGDSGGPLFDLNGRLLGVHSMIGSDITNNRHVAIDVIRRDWARLEDGETWGELGDFDTGLAGSTMFGTDLIWEQYEARVRVIVPGSPAQRAGLRRGDRLLRVDGQAIADPLELSLILGERNPGDEVAAEVDRGGERVELTVTLGEWPERSPESRIPVRRRPGRFEKAGTFALAEFRRVASNGSDSVVRVLNRDTGKQLALGTVVTADGYVVTKHSEVDDAATLSCEFDNGRRLRGKIVAFDERFDVALLKVSGGGLQPIVWQDTPAEVGQLLVSPDTDARPVAIGVVSVGSRKLDETAFLGVAPQDHPRGAMIGEIIPDSSAERAGLKARDIIRQINDRQVTGRFDLIRRIQQFRPGDTIRVEVEREVNRSRSEVREMKIVLSGRFVAGDWRRQFERNNLMGSPLSRHASGFPRVLQHDTVLKPNECGGPLLNVKGEAVGINIARAGRVMSYAIPVREARGLIDRLIEQAG